MRNICNSNKGAMLFFLNQTVMIFRQTPVTVRRALSLSSESSCIFKSGSDNLIKENRNTLLSVKDAVWLLLCGGYLKCSA